MKNLRAALWIGLALILIVNVQVWMREFGAQDAAAAAEAQRAFEQEKKNNPLAAAVPTVPTGESVAGPAPATARQSSAAAVAIL